jgi:probable addiction module antidote protein
MNDFLWDYDPASALTTTAARAVFIADALATGSDAHFVAAVGITIKAFGSTEMARLTGIAVADLEQLFGVQGDPDLYRLIKVLRVLGVSLSVVATAPIHPKH